MLMDKCRLSIIIPVYNVEEYLDRCLSSILDQEFTSYEVILVDDGSTDGGASVVYGYYAKYHAMPIVQENAVMVVKDPAMEKGAYFEILNNGFEYFDSVGDMHFYHVVAPKIK